MSKKKQLWETVNGAPLHRIILESSLGLPYEESTWAATLSNPSLDWPGFGRLLFASGLARGMGEFLKSPVVLENAPDSFPQMVKDLARDEGLKLAVTRQALSHIGEALTNLHTDAVLLKGAALTMKSWESGEPVPAKTPGDIDILVAKEDALDLRNALLAGGFRGEPQQAVDLNKTHLEIVQYERLGVEIHIRIADEDWLGALPESEMLCDREAISGWAPFHVLGPEAFLLHTSVHLARHYFTFGLKTMWGQYFTLLTQGTQLDWEKLARWATLLRDERRFWVALQIFHEDLGFPFPEHFMARAPSDRRQRWLIEFARERLLLMDYLDPLFRQKRVRYEAVARDTWSGWFAAVSKFPRAWRDHRKRFRDLGYRE